MGADGVQMLSLVGAGACIGVALLRIHTQERLRRLRSVWRAYEEVPREDRQYREWLVDLVARGRGTIDELEEMPRRFRETLLAVSQDELAERSYESITLAWVLLCLLMISGCDAAGLHGVESYVVAGSSLVIFGRIAYPKLRAQRCLPARIAVLEQSLAALPSAGVAGELE